jgi:hypothetical protein
VVLDAVSLEGLRAAVIHVHRERYGHGTLRQHEPIAIVRIDLQIIGNDLELVAGHLEDFVVVDAHKKEGRKVECPGVKFRCYLRRRDGGVKSELRDDPAAL